MCMYTYVYIYRNLFIHILTYLFKFVPSFITSAKKETEVEQHRIHFLLSLSFLLFGFGVQEYRFVYFHFHNHIYLMVFFLFFFYIFVFKKFNEMETSLRCKHYKNKKKVHKNKLFFFVCTIVVINS